VDVLLQGQNIQLLGGVDVSYLDVPNRGPSVTVVKCHTGSICHCSKMLKGQSVSVVNCHSGQNVRWMYRVGWNVVWSVCGWT
jgi:hypothetical protein